LPGVITCPRLLSAHMVFRMAVTIPALPLELLSQESMIYSITMCLTMASGLSGVKIVSTEVMQAVLTRGLIYMMYVG
jgi:hypothetical protein